MTSAQKWFGKNPQILIGVDEAAFEKAHGSLLAASEQADSQKLTRSLNDRDELARFLVCVSALSPFLAGSLMRFASNLELVFDIGLSARIETLIASASEIPTRDDLNEAALMTSLRAIKSEAHMLIGLGDLAQVFTVAQTTDYLSRLASNCLSAAVDWLLIDLHTGGKIRLSDPQEPSAECGLIILGMGKLGGNELNYSSDIDIVIYFDLDAKGMEFADSQDPTEVMGRFVRRLVRIMQERTGDGYVFRTDLRLRPDPGATPLAINVEAALNYYESRGQNWERAAFIKARPVAGDLAAGEKFLRDLKPFIWRRYLDYAAISDVQAIKRQIHAHKGHGKITVLGHNLKLGRGGIREIEFFVQTQQLIAGGRARELRHRQTVEMLKRLCADGWIAGEVRDELTTAYAFLRRAEHVVQMIADEQVHDLPSTTEELGVVAALLGYPNTETFSEALLKTLSIVEMHFGDLFEDDEGVGATTGNLVFTGEDPDPDTLNNLHAMGFERGKDIWNIVRTWHFGRYKALQSQQAREQLTAFTSSLLNSFAQSGQADETLLRFDALLAGLPAGVQLFSMLNNNRQLLSLMTTILSSAPRLANIITARPLIFDGMLEPAFFEGVPETDEQRERLDFFIGEATAYEDVLDRLRIFAAEQRFLIGVRLLTGSIVARTTAEALSSLADMLLQKALLAASTEVAERHGSISGARVCLVALGKLGSCEMTAGSDVDLLLIYDAPDMMAESDGAKPLAPSQYYARVTQRLIAALSAPTAEGVLYDVDFRLRPSGNKGPLATSLKSFSTYQRGEAWTWEHMALTRARPICGDESLMAEMEAERVEILNLPRDREKTASDIIDMRQRLLLAKPATSVWDLKMSRGGIIDIEFLTQFWMLTALPNCKHALTDGNLNARSAEAILQVLNDEILTAEDKTKLLDALGDFTLVSHLIKLCSADEFDPQASPKGLIEQLCSATNMADVGQLEAHLHTHMDAVREIFDRFLPMEKV